MRCAVKKGVLAGTPFLFKDAWKAFGLTFCSNEFILCRTFSSVTENLRVKGASVENVKKHFEEEAPEFDGLILKLIPYYKELTDALVSAIPFDRLQPVTVLDLGCGTGTVALNILKAFPNARITCLDFAANMIDMARAKLSTYPQTRFVVGDFRNFEFSESYQVVVSSLALHHLETDEEKRGCYQKIHDALAPGGCFYNADVVLASGEHLQDVYMEKWTEYMGRKVPREEIENTWLPKYRDEDRPAKLMEQLSWLSAIGFLQVDVLWKYYNFAVYGGIKEG